MTHWVMQKVKSNPILQRTFWKHFLGWKCRNFNQTIIEKCSAVPMGDKPTLIATYYHNKIKKNNTLWLLGEISTGDRVLMAKCIMTSCHGDAFPLNGPLWAESLKESVIRSFDTFFVVYLSKLLNKLSNCRDSMTFVWARTRQDHLLNWNDFCWSLFISLLSKHIYTVQAMPTVKIYWNILQAIWVPSQYKDVVLPVHGFPSKWSSYRDRITHKCVSKCGQHWFR